ncbi:MAG: glycosyl hydrolase, partial [Acidobacteriota bacterium]|nr:glycosyl hydrolase [Acidobacteriota bacterium]
ACPRGNVSPGDGVYKSTDAGRTWRHIGLPDAGQIGRIVVHPKDSDLVYAAVLGNVFGASAERGVYRSANGGLTWSRVLFVSEDAGAVDLAMDPVNPRNLYAAIWQARRTPWTMISGGPGSGLFKSSDGGNTWVKLGEGLPEGVMGRIAVTVSPAAPNRVWALVEAEDGGLFRSDNGGEEFRLVTGERELRQRAWYYTHLEADPKDADTVYVLNVMFWKSIDGGKNFSPIRTPHGDNHALWINPDDPTNLIEGNDGGANITFNGGRTWSEQSNQPTSEIYRVTVDNQYPYWLYGGQQDNSAVAIPSRSPGGIAWRDWYAPAGCETATVAVDPRNPNITYGGCYGGSIGRHDRDLEYSQEVMAWPQMAVGQQAKDLKYRFQWNSPIRISPHDPTVLYHCANVVLKSTDEGRNWTEISPDLTRDDESRQGYAGEPITRDNTGVEVYGTVFAFEESPHQAGLLWAGSDDGLVHISDDGGASWRDITPGAMPEWGTVNAIELSAHDPARVFIAVQKYRENDFRPHIFRTNDSGATWKLLTTGANGIPADHFVRAVREDPDRKGLLYAGTEFGMYVSFDDGANWKSLQLNLPISPITDLAVKRGDLVVATQGRSFWILDDLTVLHQMSADVANTAPHLFTPRTVVRWVDQSGGGGRGAVGQNPPFGAVVHYVLPPGLDQEDADEVKLEILDADGEVLRSFSSQEPEKRAPSPWRRFFPELAEPPLLDARSGANRTVWNLALPDAGLVDDAVLWGWPGGPTVPPSSYQVRLTVGEWTDTATFEVIQDPRTDIPQEAFDEQYALASEIWQELTRAHETIETIRDLRGQIEAVTAHGDDEAIVEESEAIVKSLTAIEEQLTQVKNESSQDILNFQPQIDNQLLNLQSVVESALGAPYASSREVFALLKSELDGYVAELDAVVAEQLPELERLIAEAGAPRVVVQ